MPRFAGLPGRLAIDPSFKGTQLHVVGAAQLPSEPSAFLLGDHLAATHKTYAHSPVVRLAGRTENPLTAGGSLIVVVHKVLFQVTYSGLMRIR
jgi:hypothetical protein